VRRAALLAVPIAVLAVAGCGSQEVRTIAAWRAQPPYIPPPDPSARAAKRAAAPAATSPATDQRAPSDAQVARELRQAFGSKSARAIDAAGLTGDGMATVPPSAPARVADVINAANQVARKPYVYGGGHGRLAGETFIDTANAGHAWMTVAGLRFDTSGRSAGGSRWQAASRTVAGFTVRHPPGM
jgi:hypothetical protein